MVQIFVMRFRKVEVQIVQDEHETTHNIYRRLKYMKWTNFTFYAAVLIF